MSSVSNRAAHPAENRLRSLIAHLEMAATFKGALSVTGQDRRLHNPLRSVSLASNNTEFTFALMHPKKSSRV
jgi:hypothetical protein